jgi:hypothetical protein
MCLESSSRRDTSDFPTLVKFKFWFNKIKIERASIFSRCSKHPIQTKQLSDVFTDRFDSKAWMLR